MSNKIEYSRLVMKRSTQSGVIPSATASTVIDENWLPTDILIGEFFMNVADDRLWMRTNNGIAEVLTTSTYSGTDIWESTGSEIQLSSTYSGFPVIPATDDTSDLGSATYRWKDLYLGSILDVASHLTYSVSGSPVYKYDISGIELQSDKPITSSNGGGQLDLDYGGAGSEVILSTDNGNYNESGLYMEPFSANLFVADGGAGTNNLFMNAGSQYISMNAGGTNDSIIMAVNNNIIFQSKDGGNFTTTNVDISPTAISSRNSTIGSGVVNGFIIGGDTNNIQAGCTNSFVVGGSDNVISAFAFDSGVINSFGSTMSGFKNTIMGALNSEIKTSSQFIASGVIIGGGNNLIDSTTPTPILHSTIINGQNNSILGGTFQSAIISSDGSLISPAPATVTNANIIIGGQYHVLGSGGGNGIFVGSNGDVNGFDSAIIGGDGGTINNYDRTVIIGGQSITANLDDATYVPDFVITKSHAIPTSTSDTVGDTGSITWDANFIYVKTSGGTGAGGWKRVALSTF